VWRLPIHRHGHQRHGRPRPRRPGFSHVVLCLLQRVNRVELMWRVSTYSDRRSLGSSRSSALPTSMPPSAPVENHSFNRSNRTTVGGGTRGLERFETRSAPAAPAAPRLARADEAQDLLFFLVLETWTSVASRSRTGSPCGPVTTTSTLTTVGGRSARVSRPVREPRRQGQTQPHQHDRAAAATDSQRSWYCLLTRSSHRPSPRPSENGRPHRPCPVSEP